MDKDGEVGLAGKQWRQWRRLEGTTNLLPTAAFLLGLEQHTCDSRILEAGNSRSAWAK